MSAGATTTVNHAAASDRRRDRRRQFAALGVALLFLVLVVLVLIEPRWLVGLDQALGRPAYRLTQSHDLLRGSWSFDASAQRPDLPRVALLVGAVLLWVSRRRLSATWVLAAALVSVVAAPGIKVLVDRPRPVWPDPITVLSDPSFPSGHATAAWVLAAAVVLLCWDQEIPRRWRRPLMVAAIGGAVVVSADRVFLGVHFPSDVVGGALLGVLVALTCNVTARAVQRAWDRHHATGLGRAHR